MLKNTIFMTLLLTTCLMGGARAQTMGNTMSTTSSPAMITMSGKGNILVNPKGMTLYTFDKDKAGMSVCNATCVRFWPPFLAPVGASASGRWSIITRKDGTKQWAYKGKPLYTWVKDREPGDTTGGGVKTVWHVAQP